MARGTSASRIIDAALRRQRHPQRAALAGYREKTGGMGDRRHRQAAASSAMNQVATLKSGVAASSGAACGSNQNGASWRRRHQIGAGKIGIVRGGAAASARKRRRWRRIRRKRQPAKTGVAVE